jgi:hypothetical protein
MKLGESKMFRLHSASLLAAACLVTSGCIGFPDEFRDIPQEFTHPGHHLIRNTPPVTPADDATVV